MKPRLGCIFLFAVMAMSVPTLAADYPSGFDEALTQPPGRWIEEARDSEGRDEDRIETDRHDFTQSVKTVGKGVGQFEFGYLYTYKDSGEEISHTHATPELLFRYGVTDWLEVAARFNYVWRFFDTEEEVENEDSAEDLRLALKFETSEQCGCKPSTAVDVRITVPSGGNSWSTDKVEVGMRLIYAWELGKRIELSGSTGFGTNGVGDVAFQETAEGKGDDFTLWFTSVALGFPLGESMEAYVEYYGLWSYGLAHETAQNYFNIGIDFLISPDFVLDFRIGKGLSPDAEDFFTGFGGGFRF